ALRWFDPRIGDIDRRPTEHQRRIEREEGETRSAAGPDHDALVLRHQVAACLPGTDSHDDGPGEPENYAPRQRVRRCLPVCSGPRESVPGDDSGFVAERGK